MDITRILVKIYNKITKFFANENFFLFNNSLILYAVTLALKLVILKLFSKKCQENLCGTMN